MSNDDRTQWNAIVLAAGEGTRMKSDRPKVLHAVAGRPMVSWVVGTALEAGAARCVVVVGHGRSAVEAELERTFGDAVDIAVQPEQRGTGDAVRCAIEAHPSLGGRAVVLYGDCPLIPVDLVISLIDETRRRGARLGLVTSELGAPSGYGRIVRDEDGHIVRIVEDRDCSVAERRITEVNPGIYDIDLGFLRSAIGRLRADNAQSQLYLTDLVELAGRGGEVASVYADMSDLRGVNDPKDLAVCAARRRRRIAEDLASGGVMVSDLDRLYVDADCEVEPGAMLGAGVHLRGRCRIGQGASVDVGCVLTDVTVEASASVLPYTVATSASIGEGASVGPFSHLRPASRLGPRSKVGNFSETKNTTIGEASKVNHLAYVGDGVIGARVNIGAGTIFCNYDGERKHVTTIGDEVFIGSDSQLVAPVTVERGAYVASGTTVTRDVPEDALAVARVKQQNKAGYAARLRARLRGRTKARSSD